MLHLLAYIMWDTAVLISVKCRRQRHYHEGNQQLMIQGASMPLLVLQRATLCRFKNHYKLVFKIAKGILDTPLKSQKLSTYMTCAESNSTIELLRHSIF